MERVRGFVGVTRESPKDQRKRRKDGKLQYHRQDRLNQTTPVVRDSSVTMKKSRASWRLRASHDEEQGGVTIRLCDFAEERVEDLGSDSISRNKARNDEEAIATYELLDLIRQNNETSSPSRKRLGFCEDEHEKYKILMATLWTVYLTGEGICEVTGSVCVSDQRRRCIGGFRDERLKTLRGRRDEVKLGHKVEIVSIWAQIHFQPNNQIMSSSSSEVPRE